MEIVTIQLQGYGCEIARGILSKKDYQFIKKDLNNIWVRGLHCHLTKHIDIDEQSYDYGILNGDILITVDDELILDLPLSFLDTQSMVEEVEYDYPKTKDIIMTSIQYDEGLISDTTFILDGKFDITKLKVIKKHIQDKVDKTIVSDLICEMYYNGENIPINNTITDLRMSEVFFDNKNEENQYR